MNNELLNFEAKDMKWNYLFSVYQKKKLVYFMRMQSQGLSATHNGNTECVFKIAQATNHSWFYLIIYFVVDSKFGSLILIVLPHVMIVY